MPIRLTETYVHGALSCSNKRKNNGYGRTRTTPPETLRCVALRRAALRRAALRWRKTVKWRARNDALADSSTLRGVTMLLIGLIERVNA